MTTGIYVRVMRDGAPQNVDLAALTFPEIESWLATKDAPTVARTVSLLLAQIRNFGEPVES